jgi:hypothetical protein
MQFSFANKRMFFMRVSPYVLIYIRSKLMGVYLL